MVQKCTCSMTFMAKSA